ncbi:hypothetical protein ACQUFY_26275 (plasmid) [Robbsia andropogonis]|uniref:hypothetical protein n=1 Tax=Robbsia andropogonis TaxID=28092 RepID=UPI003D2315A0
MKKNADCERNVGWELDCSCAALRGGSARLLRINDQQGTQLVHVPAGRRPDFSGCRHPAWPGMSPHGREGNPEQADYGTHVRVGGVGQLVELLKRARKDGEMS